MSRDAIVAKRYAKALFSVAQVQSVVQGVEQDLRSVVDVIEQHDDFHKLLLHPNIDASAKKKMLSDVFEGKIAEPVLNLLHLLVERRRESILPVLLKYYIEIADNVLGQASAIVYSPFALTDEESQHIAETFGRITGKSIRIQTVIEPSLLGGIQVRIGDRLYDGSLSGKLARLHKTISESQAL